MSIYLDNAATSWPKPENVYRDVDRFMREVGTTPGRGGYRQEHEANRIADLARAALADLFNAPDPEGVVFTLNATQAINMALKGLLRPGDHVITSSIEHNAVWRPLKRLEQTGIDVTAVPCQEDCTLRLENIKEAINPNTSLIAFIQASNVLGTILPVAEIGELASKNQILLLVDAAQSAGSYPIDMQAMQIDLLAFPGHKGLYGPHGTGGLIIRPGIKLDTWVEGGSGVESELESMPEKTPERLEAGTQNIAGIAGLLSGVNFVQDTGVDLIRRHEMELCQMLTEGLKQLPGCVILGPEDMKERAPVVSAVFDGYVPDQLAAVLDKVFGIATRAGLHCAPQAHRTAGTLETGALRLSPGYFTTQADINTAIEAITTIIEEP